MLTHVLAHIATQGDTTIMLAWRRTLKSLRDIQQGSHEVTIDRQTRPNANDPKKKKKIIDIIMPGHGRDLFQTQTTPHPQLTVYHVDVLPL